MRTQHMPQPGRQARTAVLMLVVMALLVLVVTTVAGIMTAGVRVAHEAQDACRTLLQHLNTSALEAPAHRSLSRPEGENQSRATVTRRQVRRRDLRDIAPLGREHRSHQIAMSSPIGDGERCD